MADFQDQHRMFVQGMLWKKICRASEVRYLHKSCCKKSGVEPGELKLFVEKINNTLKPMNMAIDKGIDEITGEHYYVLINTCDNAVSRLSSDYSLHELEFFRKIICCILETGEGKASSTEILNITDESSKISTKKEAEELIIKFSKDGWLLEKGGCIFFSTRAIVELQPFFREHVQDIPKCKLCTNFVFQGDTCENCEIKLHNHCKKLWVERGRKACPACNVAYPNVENNS